LQNRFYELLAIIINKTGFANLFLKRFLGVITERLVFVYA